MKKMSKILCLILALAMVFAFAGCGKTEEKTDVEKPSSGSDVEAPKAPASESDVPALETVVPGKLIMSTNAAFPPYEMVADDGSFEGIDVEIADAIAKKLGLELQVDDMGFDAALQAAQQGKSDIIMAGVTVTEKRLEVMEFSDSYSNGVQVIIVKEGSEVTLDNMGDGMIGTQQGTTGYIYCSGDYGDDHVTAYDNGASAVQALVNGQVDCVVIDSNPAKEYVKANPGLVILDTEYANEDYAIGMAKGNFALLDAVNNALAELKADGTVQAIVDKYIAA